MDYAPIFARHKRIAFQLSGGKDSIASLHMLYPFWERMTVYWLDTGDTLPEVRDVVLALADELPHFERVASSAEAVIAQYGLPSDIVPANSTHMGIAANGGGVLIQDRYACCLRARMLPMHQRMLDDGITLIVRGQKNADANKSPLRSGDVENGIEYLFPVQDWDDEDVLIYLRERDIAYPAVYDRGLRTAPDCMTCSGWWEEGRAAYLKQWHPVKFYEYKARLNTISDAVAGHIAQFNEEVAQ